MSNKLSAAMSKFKPPFKYDNDGQMAKGEVTKIKSDSVFIQWDDITIN